MLKDQVAIITGAGRGVGKETALLMASHGAKVVIADLDEREAKAVVDEILNSGGEAISFVGDVTDKSFSKDIVEQTVKSFKSVDILVNNAGYTWDGMIHKMTDEQFQAMIDVHLTAPFRLIREVAPLMRDQGKEDLKLGIEKYRKIVNISSVAGVAGNVGQANYSAAKAGIIGLTKTVAREWGPFNVNCNAVAFGLIDTRLTQPKEQGETFNGIGVGLPSNVRQMFEQTIPQRRAGTVKEAAESIFYLASPLSNYTNGQVLNVNGGFYT